MVADGVLVADILGDFGGDSVNVGKRAGEEGEAAGFVGKQLQGAAGAVRFRASGLIAEEEADGVDDGTAEVLDAADGLFEIERGGVIFAVGDDDEHLFGAPGVVRKLVGGGDNGVVESGAAAGLDVSERAAEFGDAGGEILVEEGFVGEVDDEGLVLRIGGADQVESCGIDGGTLVAHGAGVIDEEADGDGDIGVVEGDDGLGDVVFPDLEVGFGEVLDEVAVLIDDGAGEEDFIDVAGEGIDAVLALDFLVGAGVTGADAGIVGGVGGDDGVVVDVEGGLGLRLEGRGLEGLPGRRGGSLSRGRGAYGLRRGSKGAGK